MRIRNRQVVLFILIFEARPRWVTAFGSPAVDYNMLQRLWLGRTMQLSSLTHFAFLINSVLDTGPVVELGFAEIHTAARAGQLVEHLATRLGKTSYFWMLLGNADELKQVDLALGEAAAAIEGREAGVAGVRQ